MRVTIITTHGITTSSNGVNRYSYELIKNLKNKYQDIQIDVLSPKKEGNFISVLLFSLIVLPLKLITKKSDLFHVTSPDEVIAPILLNKKTIVTVHDVIYMSYPKGSKFLKRLYFRICTYFISKAHLIITDSEYSKNEIHSKLHIPLSKIIRNYLGVNEKFKIKKDIKKIKAIGYLGGNTERKNIKTLVLAFGKLQREKKLSDYELHLAINRDNKLIALIDSYKIKNVVFLNSINEDEVVDFYNRISLFVYPSLYEGFGLPPLEAMASGCPVICSNRSSIPEVTGNAALIVDPTNINDLHSSMHKVLTDKRLYNSLIKRGLEKSKEYKWKKTIKNTIAAYRSSL